MAIKILKSITSKSAVAPGDNYSGEEAICAATHTAAVVAAYKAAAKP